MIKVERIPTSVAGCEASTSPRAPFLKGPIPLAWLTAASALSGKALQIALAIRFLSGVQRSRVVRLAPSVVARFGVDRHAAYRALKVLECAQLVKAVRRRGRAPEVTILEGNDDGR